MQSEQVSERMIRRPMTATGYNTAGATRARLCYWSPGNGGEELPSYLLHLASSSMADSRDDVFRFLHFNAVGIC